MKVLTGIMLAISMLLALRLTGPAADSIAINTGIALSEHGGLDPEVILEMDQLINGNTFEFRNNDTSARLTFRNGNFVLVCQSSVDAQPETLHGTYFFAKDIEGERPVVVLRRSKARQLFSSQKNGPLSFAHQMLSLNASLKVDCLGRRGILGYKYSSECLILSGFHPYKLQTKN
jgi:hypothetical protein